MDNELKDIIFQYLNHITEGANVYHMDNGSVWIINPEKKHWYTELEKSGKCWLRNKKQESPPTSVVG